MSGQAGYSTKTKLVYLSLCSAHSPLGREILNFTTSALWISIYWLFQRLSNLLQNKSQAVLMDSKGNFFQGTLLLQLAAYCSSNFAFSTQKILVSPGPSSKSVQHHVSGFLRPEDHVGNSSDPIDLGLTILHTLFSTAPNAIFQEQGRWQVRCSGQLSNFTHLSNMLTILTKRKWEHLPCLGCWGNRPRCRVWWFSLAAITAQAVELAVVLSEARFQKPTEVPVLDKSLGDPGVTFV